MRKNIFPVPRKSVDVAFFLLMAIDCHLNLAVPCLLTIRGLPSECNPRITIDQDLQLSISIFAYLDFFSKHFTNEKHLVSTNNNW